MVNLEARKPAGEWKKAAGESYAHVVQGSEDEPPLGLGFEKVPSITLLMRQLKLTRFRGHRTVWVQGVHDGQDKIALRSRVPSPDGGTSARRPYARGTGYGV